MSNELLSELNAFRAIDGKEPFKDWRKARHLPMLEAYRADAGAGKAVKIDAEFEASPDELAAQVGRESADIARDEALVAEIVKPKRERKPKVEKVEKVATTEGASLATSPVAAAAWSGDFAGNKAVQEAAREAAKAKSYKEAARYDKSLIEKPVGFVHQFLSDNPGLTRKEAVIALTEGYGVNYSTARTQYQKWFAKQPKKDASK